MRRRDLVALAASLAALRPLVARAQQKAMRVVGFLSLTSSDNAAPFCAEIWRGLKETGYVEGQNAAGEYRFANSQYDRLPAFAADLVQHQVDLIFAGGAIAAAAAKGATSTPGRLSQRRRSGQARFCRQPGAAGWQPHRCLSSRHRVDAKADRTGRRIGSSCERDRVIGESPKRLVYGGHHRVRSAGGTE
jgi:hypothetical protein